MPEPTPPDLILASTSRYRRELLERFGLPFTAQPPLVDETAMAGERPEPLARRLSLAKALAVARANPRAWVIGSDQTATIDGVNIIGKPGDHERARVQLREASGRTLHFYTGLALVCIDSGIECVDVSEIRAQFRELDDEQIDTYLRRDQPYDCAGAARSESLGIALLESMSGDDPTALIGLPLTRLAGLMMSLGYDPITRRYRPRPAPRT